MARLNLIALETNKRVIDLAALECFVRSGYHGVTMRDIAEQAKISLGSLYNYYDDKLALFESLIDHQSKAFLALENGVVQYFLRSKFPDDLESLAGAIKASVTQYEAYFKLMYVDVVEFDGSHIRDVFSNLDEKFKKVMKKRFAEIGMLGPKSDVDPVFAFTAIYLAFYNYFILAKLFGATHMYGKKTDRQVIGDLITLFLRGIGKT